MRKIITILILIILGVLLYFNYDNIRLNRASKKTMNYTEDNIVVAVKDDYEGLLADVRGLQKYPDQIAEFNAKITKIIYSGKLEEDEIELLFKLQREYFSEETLAQNPEDVNFQRLIEELERYKEAKYFMIGYKVMGPQFLDVKEDENQKLIFDVIYYMNVTTEGIGEIFKGYIFEQNEDKVWELRGFGSIDDIPVVL